jgi:CBS domain-containing protein
MTEPRFLTVDDVMTRTVIAVRQDERIMSAFESMSRAEIHHFPVIDDARRVVGIVSDRDLLRALAGSGHRGDPIRSCMSRDVVTVAQGTPAHEAAKVLMDHRFHAIPVVDGAKVLVGVVAARDFLRFARDALAIPQE